MATNIQLPDNFIRVLQALQHVNDKALPKLEGVIQAWHAKQGTQPCTQPLICVVKKGKPNLKHPSSCGNCVQWATHLETVCFSQVQVTWRNVNPTLLDSNPIEVANAFALHLNQRPTKFEDYDTASALKIMLGFGEFHQQNKRTTLFKDPYQIIKKVTLPLFPILPSTDDTRESKDDNLVNKHHLRCAINESTLESLGSIDV